MTQKVTHEEMMAEFQGPGVDERFRTLLAKAKPIRWGFFHHLHTATYYRDRVVLIGDSAHASMPFHAAGAAMGVEDALVLSTLLERLAKKAKGSAEMGPEIRSALAAYDSVRRPRAEHQLNQSAECGGFLYFTNPETGDDMNKILHRLQNERFNWLWFHDLAGDVQLALDRMDASKTNGFHEKTTTNGTHEETKTNGVHETTKSIGVH